MNLVERTFKEYLEVFHSTLSKSADEYFPANLSHKLLHLSFLPAQITGYVSTQFGIGFEYIPAKETSIKIVIGGVRVESLFVKPFIPLSESGAMFGIEGVDCLISGIKINIKTLLPVKLLKEPSNVSIKEVCFEFGSQRKIVTYAELYSNRNIESWSREKAIIRAKDEVLAALVELNRSQVKNISLDEYISVYKERTVLLLGDYDETGLQRLQVIKDTLKELGYEPLLIKDIPDHPYQDISQKVIAVGAVSKFIVVDDSSKSGHLSEIEICKQNRWITILLRADGIGGTWMTAGASAFSNVILEKSYSLNSLTKDILEATLWAEKTIEELKKILSDIYPWRKTDKK
jgi:hypothetical protein